MVDRAIDVFAVEEVFDEGTLYYRLSNEGLFGISAYVSEVLRDFIGSVYSETLSGVDLVQAWIEATHGCVSKEHPKLEFPAVPGGTPVFPEVIAFMGIDDLDVKKTALSVYAALDPRYTYPY